MNRTTCQTEPSDHAPFTERDPRCQRVLRAAERLFSQQPHWVEFFRRILGPRGIVRRTFPSRRGLQRFEQTKTYAKIQQWLACLRASQPSSPVEQEPTRVITVRLPKSLHEALRLEAYQHCTSMNKLCISKLLQFIEGGLVPNERSRLGQPPGASRQEQVPARGAEQRQ